MFTVAQAQSLTGLEDAVRDVAIQAMQGPSGVRDIMEVVLDEATRQLKGFTQEMRPPIKPGGPLRRAHLGHWADRTGVLAANYRYEVTGLGEVVEGSLINDDPGGYGAILEKQGFFFVLNGVMDPGGPVDVILRQTIPRFSGWTLTG
jgi:hypothetical protein